MPAYVEILPPHYFDLKMLFRKYQKVPAMVDHDKGPYYNKLLFHAMRTLNPLTPVCIY